VVSRSNRAVVAVLALGHGVTDLYANFLPALLPVFQSKFDLSKTLIGVIIFAVSTSGSLFQVLYGYLGDKWGKRFFLVPGPAIAAIFMCLIAMSPSFSVLLILLIIGGMGVSAFHPHAASSVGDMAGGRRGFGLSIFMTGGTIGFAAGPLIAAALISSIGAIRMPVASVFGIITSFLLYKYVLADEERHIARKSIKILDVIRPNLGPLSLLSMIVIFRATVSIVFTNFMPILMYERKLSLVMGGGVVSLFLLSIGFGTLLGGYLYDRVSRKKLLILSLLLSSPLLYTLVAAEGPILAIFLVLSGLALGCPNPIPLAFAQELMPEGASTASSIMMGFSWGVAGVLAMLFGVMIDRFFGSNVAPGMNIAAFLPILAAILALLLPRK
jgi:FSR family fosmidomycin resistance protein-like MFS transporter